MAPHPWIDVTYNGLQRDNIYYSAGGRCLETAGIEPKFERQTPPCRDSCRGPGMRVHLRGQRGLTSALKLQVLGDCLVDLSFSAYIAKMFMEDVDWMRSITTIAHLPPCRRLCLHDTTAPCVFCKNCFMCLRRLRR